MTRAEIIGCAQRIRFACERGCICPEVGSGLRTRALLALRLATDGEMTMEEAGRIAAEALNVAMAFPPLPRRTR